MTLEIAVGGRNERKHIHIVLSFLSFPLCVPSLYFPFLNPNWGLSWRNLNWKKKNKGEGIKSLKPLILIFSHQVKMLGKSAESLTKGDFISFVLVLERPKRGLFLKRLSSYWITKVSCKFSVTTIWKRKVWLLLTKQLFN